MLSGFLLRESKSEEHTGCFPWIEWNPGCKKGTVINQMRLKVCSLAPEI